MGIEMTFPEALAGPREDLLAEPPPSRVGAALSVRNVSHTFSLRGAALPVLVDISFNVAPGVFVALVGPSGVVVFQDPTLLPGSSVHDNAALGLDPVACCRGTPATATTPCASAVLRASAMPIQTSSRSEYSNKPPSPAPWSTSRVCCFSPNPSASWTASRG